MLCAGLIFEGGILLCHSGNWWETREEGTGQADVQCLSKCKNLLSFHHSHWRSLVLNQGECKSTAKHCD